MPVSLDGVMVPMKDAQHLEKPARARFDDRVRDLLGCETERVRQHPAVEVYRLPLGQPSAHQTDEPFAIVRGARRTTGPQFEEVER